MEFKEFSAKNVDEAIIKASIELEIPSEDLEIQVLYEGSSGFLGFGSKLARIKVRRKEEPVSVEGVKPVVKETKEIKETNEVKETKKEPKQKPATHKKQEKKPEVKKEKKHAPKHAEEKEESVKEEKVIERTEEEIDKIKKTADEFLAGVFKAMDLEVIIKMNYAQEDDTLEVEFEGEDMGILIGKRGQTLDSLQYLTSLVINKGVQGYVRVKLDTENYRNRRKETLENLAKSIAYKVRKTRKPVSLEPMNPYERRIIHSALQGNKYVETTSEGNEPYRHVVVKLKNR
ncbi:MAG: RNA-binding cell elongation regulator Jag/EloR [Lachnospiraceae bacterium]|jgi:spoIIIJ-associated protein